MFTLMSIYSPVGPEGPRTPYQNTYGSEIKLTAHKAPCYSHESPTPRKCIKTNYLCLLLYLNLMFASFTVVQPTTGTPHTTRNQDRILTTLGTREREREAGVITRSRTASKSSRKSRIPYHRTPSFSFPVHCKNMPGRPPHVVYTKKKGEGETDAILA